MNRKFLKGSIILFLVLFLVACKEKNEAVQKEQKKEKEPVTVEAETTIETKATDKNVVVWVDETPVTKSQLNLAVDRTLGASAGYFMNEELQEKILNSVISSRAMARLAEKKMDEFDLQELEDKVQAYREELLVKRYIKQEIVTTPVSDQQVKEYYEKHLDEFGAGTIKKFEVIESIGKANEEQRRAFLKKLGSVKKRKNWKQFVQSMKKKGLPLNYRMVNAKVSLLKNPLASIVKKTPAGQVSPMHFSTQMLIVRVLEEKKVAPKPMREVSAEIRQKLVPVNLKKSVRTLSEKARSQVKIRFNNQENQNP